MRWLGSLLDFIADVFVLNQPRKGSIIPPEQIPSEEALAPVRERLASDLLNAYPPCRCWDCECKFNKTDPDARPGRGVE